MGEQITIRLTPEELQAVTNCVGEFVSAWPMVATEDSPIYRAERVLDGSLLAWEEAQEYSLTDKGREAVSG